MASQRAKTFVNTWRDELLACRPSNTPGVDENDLWEGAQAYKNLRDCGRLEFMLFREEPKKLGWKRRQLLNLLFTEIRKYERYSGKVSAINNELKEAADFTKRMKKWFSDELKQIRHLTDIRERLTKYADDLDKDHTRFEQKRRYFWRSPTGLEPILREPDYVWGPDKDMDLDGGFQKRVARVLRLYLPKEEGISLRTICRLVVLVYLAAGLAKEQGETLISKSTGEELNHLNPIDLEKKFRRAGLDRKMTTRKKGDLL